MSKMFDTTKAIRLKSLGKGVVFLLPEPTIPPQINDSINWERKNEEGATEYIQEYKGREIPTITLVWKFSTDDFEDADFNLKVVRKFYEWYENGKPAIWQITYPFINAHGIKKVVVNDFHSEKQSEYVIKVVLKLEEYRPKIIKKEKKTKGQGKTTTTETNSKDVKIPCKENNFADKKCREYYYRYRREKEKGLTSASFQDWLKATIKKEGKPLSADD